MSATNPSAVIPGEIDPYEFEAGNTFRDPDAICSRPRRGLEFADFMDSVRRGEI